jgi:hypothetical protein
MFLGGRRVGDEIARGKDDAAVESLFAAIDAGQHQGRRQELEGAAHREALVAPIGDAPAARRVEHRHAEAAAMAPFERAQRRGRIVGKGRQGQQRRGQ